MIGNLRKRCTLAFGLLAVTVSALLGLTAATPAFAASSALVVSHSGPQQLHGQPTASSGAFELCDNLNPKTCLNDSGGGCGTGTWVIAWGYTHASNMNVYIIGQNNGYFNVHFQSCGNSVCVWAKNFNSGAGLVMAPCAANQQLDSWQFTGNTPDQMYNAGTHLYLTLSGQGNQAADSPYTGYPGQDFGFYSV